MSSEKLLCHQCRGYKVDFFYCTKRIDGDLCNFRYCEGCILKRYGKKEVEVARLDNWVCPKCRDECECSVCRKSRGLPPLGILTSTEQKKYIKMIDCTRKYLKRLQAQECRLPKATIPITKVAGIEMDAENVGPALQFMEYCRACFPVLNIGNGDAERILEEIAQGSDASSVHPSLLEKLQIDLLNIILTDNTSQRSCSSIISTLAGDGWVVAIKRLIESKSLFRAVPQENFQSASCYQELDTNWKLRILNFLCDLALDTKKLKPLNTTTKIPIEVEMNWKELPASKKAIALWNQLKEEEAKAARPIEEGMILMSEVEEEYERKMSLLKEDFRKAYLDMLDSFKAQNLGQDRYAKVVKPLTSDSSGRIFFQIEGYSSIAVQDVVNRDDPTSIDNLDRWYVFSEEDKIAIEEYCSCKRIWEAILQSAVERLPSRILQEHLADLDEQDHLESSDDDTMDGELWEGFDAYYFQSNDVIQRRNA